MRCPGVRRRESVLQRAVRSSPTIREALVTTKLEGAPTVYAGPPSAEGRIPRCRTIIPPLTGGWPEIAMFEWELSSESWTDRHPHSEYNFVLEGHLFVESGGITVEAHQGEVVRVPPHAVGRYWTPSYARLLTIYGPSDGEPSERLGHLKLP